VNLVSGRGADDAEHGADAGAGAETTKQGDTGNAQLVAYTVG